MSLKSSKTMLLGLFAGVALVHLAVPAWMLWEREQTLRHGEPVRFDCRPVDPHDAFRGRYVRVYPQIEPVPVKGDPIPGGRLSYLVFARDEAGEWKPATLEAQPPDEGPYLRLPPRPSELSGTASLSLPFDRYYMNERLAPEAEKTYREATTSDPFTQAELEVKIHEGNGVISRLLIGGEPIEQVIEARIDE